MNWFKRLFKRKKLTPTEFSYEPPKRYISDVRLDIKTDFPHKAIIEQIAEAANGLSEILPVLNDLKKTKSSSGIYRLKEAMLKDLSGMCKEMRAASGDDKVALEKEYWQAFRAFDEFCNKHGFVCPSQKDNPKEKHYGC